MNPIDDITNVRGDDDRRLDLLIDGELNESERRSLLLQLDQEPDGWRRCAMAFLEAQCWRKEFGMMARPAVERAGVAQPVARRSRTYHLGSLLAVAASFLLALALGIQLRDVWSPRGPEIRPAIGSVAASSGKATASPDPRLGIGPGHAERPGVPSDQWELVTPHRAEGAGRGCGNHPVSRRSSQYGRPAVVRESPGGHPRGRVARLRADRPRGSAASRVASLEDERRTPPGRARGPSRGPLCRPSVPITGRKREPQCIRRPLRHFRRALWMGFLLDCLSERSRLCRDTGGWLPLRWR